MARTEMGDIIEELVTLERAITGTRAAYAEGPESIASAPAWVNFPRAGMFSAQTGWGDDLHTLACACVKRGALHTGDERLMRPMITRFPDALHANLTLNGKITAVEAIRYEYGLIEVLSTEEESFFGVLFEVDLRVNDCPIEVAA